jgi:hypothetical protein
VAPDNAPEKLAAAIARLLSRLERDRESVLAVRASVSRFGWANIAETVVGEMRAVVDGWLSPVA